MAVTVVAACCACAASFVVCRGLSRCVWLSSISPSPSSSHTISCTSAQFRFPALLALPAATSLHFHFHTAIRQQAFKLSLQFHIQTSSETHRATQGDNNNNNNKPRRRSQGGDFCWLKRSVRHVLMPSFSSCHKVTRTHR